VERILELGGLPVLRAMGETPEEMLWKVAKVARTFPDSQILVLDVFATWEALAEAFTVAEDCPNLLWTTSLAYDWDMVEPFARQIGFERVLFGSDLKVPIIGGPQDPSPTTPSDRFLRPGGLRPPQRVSHLLAQLLASDITPEQQRMVAYGNAARLFGLALAPETPTAR
jgi:predicted TIM-barrel fold metal-dependent hydrolase